MSAAIVGLGHVFLLWLAREPRNLGVSKDEGVAIELYFLAGPTQADQTQRQPSPKPRHDGPRKPPQLRPPVPVVPPARSPPPLSTPPSLLPPTSDWRAALESAASRVIEQTSRDAARSAQMREGPRSATFEPLHDHAHDFGWVREHSRLVISAQGVPQWVLIQPCVIIELLKDPDCTIQHVELHGPMYEFIQQQHDATLRYDGPNAVP